jgi:hypothetical protein
MLCYIYSADVYCEECGADICEALTAERVKDTGDSGDYPQGPETAGESDSPSHCAACGEFLENPLTADGIEYVRTSGGDSADRWREFYGIRGMGQCRECGEDMDRDCQGSPRCPVCDGPCPHCHDGGI